MTRTKAATKVAHSTVIIGIHLKYQLEDGLFVKYCPRLLNIFVKLLQHEDHCCNTMQQKIQLSAKCKRKIMEKPYQHFGCVPAGCKREEFHLRK